MDPSTCLFLSLNIHRIPSTPNKPLDSGIFLTSVLYLSKHCPPYINRWSTPTVFFFFFYPCFSKPQGPGPSLRCSFLKWVFKGTTRYHVALSILCLFVLAFLVHPPFNSLCSSANSLTTPLLTPLLGSHFPSLILTLLKVYCSPFTQLVLGWWLDSPTESTTLLCIYYLSISLSFSLTYTLPLSRFPHLF